MLYQLNYDKLWQFLGLIAGIVLILVDSCQNHVDSCQARVELVYYNRLDRKTACAVFLYISSKLLRKTASRFRRVSLLRIFFCFFG